MNRRTFLTSAAAVPTVVLTGCAAGSPPRPVLPHGEPFAGIDPPETGAARLYVFRPDFTDLLLEDRPALLVNGQRRCLLAIGQFHSMQLPPGEHTVSLEPGTDESPVWRSAHGVTLQPDSTSFLAIWNAIDSSFGSTHVLVPIAGTFVPMRTNYARSKSVGVRYELIPQQEALASLVGAHRAVDAATSQPP